MPTITFIKPDGSSQSFDVEPGTSVMHAAVNNNINEIIGECCGTMACGTCHCFIEASWINKINPASALEQQILNYSAVKTQATSRLGCQILVSDDLNGLKVTVPESQY